MVAPATNMVTAPWRPSLTVSTAGWPEGDYLLRLDASSGARRHVPLTVRSASTAGKVVLLNDVTTWQAYNMWGGYDLYRGPGGFADRSREARGFAGAAGDWGCGEFRSQWCVPSWIAFTTRSSTDRAR